MLRSIIFTKITEYREQIVPDYERLPGSIMEKLSKEELRQMVNDTTTTYSMSASKLTNMIREISDYQGYSHNYTQNQKLAIKTMSFNIDDECYCVTIYQDKFPSDVLLKIVIRMIKI